ncbi:MAG: type IV pilus twitching motility protein PilT [Thermoanaerobaculia bacterium]
MSRLVPLLEALVRSAADEMILIPGEKIFARRKGQRLELGREALSAGAVEGVVSEIAVGIPGSGEAGTVPWMNGGNNFEIEISRSPSGPSITIRRSPIPASVGSPPPPSGAPVRPAAVLRPVPTTSGRPIDELLTLMMERQASDLHLSSGSVPVLRVHGEMTSLEGRSVLDSEGVRALVEPIFSEKVRADFSELNDADFAYEVPGLARFRVNVFRDRGGVGAVFRQIPLDIISVEQLGIPKAVLNLCFLSKGLVLVTGPTGSGKSTTLASMVNYINQNRSDHIITIEDPIEFVHSNIRCLVNQREVGSHTQSFKSALRAALREDPDIVLVGEMRDLETIAIAIETAETGHLVFGTLHTTTAVSTVDRIIDQFPTNQQEQIRSMLAEALKGVVAQVLCRRIGGGRVAAMEILLSNHAVASLIREAKTFQIASVMQTSKAAGMLTMNDSLFALVREKLVEPKEAWIKATDKSGLLGMYKTAGIPTSFS